jgi:hypothetical protein
LRLQDKQKFSSWLCVAQFTKLLIPLFLPGYVRITGFYILVNTQNRCFFGIAGKPFHNNGFNINVIFYYLFENRFCLFLSPKFLTFFIYIAYFDISAVSLAQDATIFVIP